MTKDITQHLSIKDKVKLFKELYTELSGYGCDGDTELAHINPYEAQLLKSIGGSGTVNQITGLREYKGGGSPPPPPPATQSVTQQSEFPEELKPFIKDVLGKAQAIQQKRESEGYIPFEGPQVASFTPEQEQAFAGISGLVGQGEQYFDPATRLAAASAISPRQAEVEQFMSPYMQNVVEIQQREAQRQADVAAQQLGAQAVGAGGFGGSRQAILEAEQQRNLQQQLGDIQARGLAAAYEDAQRRIAEQRGRELAASGQFMQLGQVAPQQQQRELTALEAVGAQRQAQSQRGLDIARQQFQEEQTFPERTLQQYQSVIRGFPLAPTTYQTSQTTTPAPSFLQQAAGLGTTAIGLAGAFGGFRNARTGGKVDPRSGLGSIVVKKQVGGNFQQAMAEAAQRSALQPEYNKEMFEKLLNREITPQEYTELVKKYRDSAMAEMPEEADIDPKFLASRTIPKNRGTAMSPLQARIAAQERRMGLSMADQPVTPLRSKAVSPAIREAAREGNELAELRRQIQSGMGGVDQPITPTLITEEAASRMKQRSILDKRTEDIKSLADMRKAIQAGMGGADQPVSPSRDTEDLINRIQKRQAEDKEFQKSVSLDDLRKQIQAGMGGADAPIIPQSFGSPQLKRTSPNYLTGSRKPGQPRVGDTTFLDRLYNAIIPDMPETKAKLQELRRQGEPIVDAFEEEETAVPSLSSLTQQARSAQKTATDQSSSEEPRLTLPTSVTLDLKPPPAPESPKVPIAKAAEPDVVNEAPSVISAQIETLKVNKPAAEKTLTSFGKEISDLRKTLDERAEKKRTTAQRRKDSIERDKFLAVAQMGLNILAQDGGQTFLQAIGKGSKNVIPTLMKLSREELEVAENLDDLDFETAKAKLGLTEAEFNRYVKQRELDIKEREAKAKELEATGGVTTGKGMQFNEMMDMFESLTGKPKQTLSRENKSLYVYKRVNEEALKRLTPKQREDDSTIVAMERSIVSNPELIGKFRSEFKQKYPSARTSTSMGQTGAPAGNIPQRPSADSVISNTQKELRDSRSGTPVTR